MTAARRSAGSLIRRIVAALVLVPLAVILIAFLVANRQPVTISLDPFSSGGVLSTPPLPLFLVLIAVLIIGVIVGGTAGWLRHGGWRRTAKRLDRDIARLHAELAAHRQAAGAAAPPAPEAATPATSEPAELPQWLKIQAPVR